MGLMQDCARDACHKIAAGRGRKYCQRPECRCYSKTMYVKRRAKARQVTCAHDGCCTFETTNSQARYCPKCGCGRKARAEYHHQRDAAPQVTQEPDPPPPTYEELKEVLTKTGSLQRRINEPPHRVTIRIPSSKPIAIVWSADWHTGSEGVDYDQFFRDIELIAAHPGLYAVVGGDGMDLFIKESLAHAAHTDAVSPTLQFAAYEHVIDYLAKSLAALSTGNHDEWLYRNTGIDWLRALARRKRIAYTGHGAMITLQVGKEEYSIYRRHKLRFWSSFNRTHGAKRAWEFAPEDAEVIVGEHKHVAGLEPFDRHGKQRWAILCGTYKTFDRFAEEQGFFGMKALSPAVIFWPREHRMLGFVDFHDAIDHLRPWYDTAYPHTE